jgi:hypothetical protein
MITKLLSFLADKSGATAQRRNRAQLHKLYFQAMKSIDQDFIEKLIHEWGMEIGDNRQYHNLQQHLYELQKRR